LGGGGEGLENLDGGIYCSQLDKEEEVEEVEPGRGGQINTLITVIIPLLRHFTI